MSGNNQLPVLLYDSECPLCTRFKQGLERLDVYHKIHYRSIQDAQVFIDYPELNPTECASVVHLITENREILKGSQTITYLLKQFPGVQHFAWLLESEKGQKIVDFFYQKVDEIRHKIKDDHESCPKCPRG
jgi:predicted DCC family thiol-disulfide oxidoreductase YuxK